jgi:hypothetical protein
MLDAFEKLHLSARHERWLALGRFQMAYVQCQVGTLAKKVQHLLIDGVDATAQL